MLQPGHSAFPARNAPLRTARHRRPRRHLILARILTIAARMPLPSANFPHGASSPWLPTARRIASLLHRALDEEDGKPRPLFITKSGQFAHNPGHWWCGVAPVEDHKIPVWEQQLSCGAAGMNMLMAAHALGYVAGWVTGWQAYSELVRTAFCGLGERIAGFIFIGHPGEELAERSRPLLDAVCRPWSSPQALLKP